MDLMVDGNGETFIIGLPMGAIWIEESVVTAMIGGCVLLAGGVTFFINKRKK